ncbi:peptidase S8/S53 domain-containing protein [Whalleya microplaca]|nr:peptidase S8/S53 domain-containing protein [Whalleya microplaca]
MRVSHAICTLLGAIASAKPLNPRASSTPAVPVADSNATVPAFVDGAYIVEFDDDDGPDSFYQALSGEDGIEVDHRMDLNYRLFKGVSFKVRNGTDHNAQLFLDKVKAKPRVKAVWPVRTVKLNVPEPVAGEQVKALKRTSAAASKFKRQNAGNDTFSPHVMTQVDKLRAKGVTGKGFRIGIVDSGIDYKHPALGGCFGPGCLVEAGYDLVGDNYLPPGTPTPDPDPYDNCVGHGTHVAGIIAAQLEGNEYGFTGAAPGVKLAAYRAWGCRATSTNEILIAAFNKAFEDGADIISCSDGELSGWADDAWGVTAARIVEAGVPVVISEGNDGSRGLFYPSTPATGHGVTGVGAVINSEYPVLLNAGSFLISNDSAATREFGFLPGVPAFTQDVKLSLWAVGNDTASTSDACDPLPEDTPDLSNKVVLLRVPDNSKCYPVDQGTNILAKGGKYVVYYAQSNLTLDQQFLYLDGIQGVATVSPYQGAQWIDFLNQGKEITVSIPNSNSTKIRLEELGNSFSGGYLGDFTSWGPTWELEASPQLAAPGASILSTYPVDLGAYRVMTGTSMSAPMAAAIYALLGEVRGTTDPKVLGSILSATSKPLAWFDREKVHDILAPVPQQGAGIVQAYDAAYLNAVLSVGSIAFNDTDHFVGNHTFSISNTGTEDVTFELGHTKAATMYTFASGTDVLRAAAFPNPTVEVWAEITFSSPKVTVPASGSADITVTAVPPSGLNETLLPVYSGYITFNGTDGQHLSLPYLGVVGSLKSTPVLQSSQVYLADYNLAVAANKTYTIPQPNPSAPANDDQSALPNVLIPPVVGTRLLHVDVVALGNSSLLTTRFFDIDTVGSLPGFPLPFVPRSEHRAYFKGFLADGTLLPAGSYRIAVSALRVFGDSSKAEDWDMLQTVPFNVQYSSTININNQENI